VATDTIDYVATDTWGNTSTRTRTVFVRATIYDGLFLLDDEVLDIVAPRAFKSSAIIP
jgi:hypothetical protein